MSKPAAILNPDTGNYEHPFREQVRDILGLDWSTRDEAIFERLRSLVKRDAAFTAAAQKFVAKVDSGDAHSVVTYSELKDALSK